jgi:hypothetical protein
VHHSPRRRARRNRHSAVLVRDRMPELCRRAQVNWADYCAFHGACDITRRAAGRWDGAPEEELDIRPA